VHDKFTALDSRLYEYLVEHGARQDDQLRRIEAETEAMGSIARMQIAPDQGALITLLVRWIDAALAVEVGTFTGYSAVCIARGLAPGGRLVCLELDEDYARTATENLSAAGLDELVDMRVGPALDSLRAMPSADRIDFAFVDADKPSYGDYYEELLSRMRPGGLIMLDNVLLGGRVLDPPEGDDSAVAMADLNDRLESDERVDLAMLGVADGITLARKR
jgi:predicted O-methyltransferase YrrM